MADTSFVSDNNIKENAKVFKESAVYLFGMDEQIGTLGPDWRPPQGKKPLGYFSEDGIEIGKESGDSTDFKGHNGDTLFSTKSGAYYTVKLTALEVKKDTVELYFSTKVDEKGNVFVDANATSQKYRLVIAGLDQYDNLIIMYAPEIQLTETESLNWKNSDMFSFGVTVRTYKSDKNIEGHKTDLAFYGLLGDKATVTVPASSVSGAGDSH